MASYIYMSTVLSAEGISVVQNMHASLYIHVRVLYHNA